VLAGLPRGYLLFGLVFVVVVTSLIVQGWTVGLAARLVKYERK
jgi:cell volume regulation protein A